jgi:GTP-binding protein
MSKQNLPIIAFVGQPNAGKSSLINKISGKPLAVTSDVAGTTRDRQYIDTAWSGVNFTMVDTAGLELQGRSELEMSLQKQIEVALAEADVIVLVADGKQPSGAVEEAVLKKFRRSKKPLLLAVNKLDSPKTQEITALEFRRLGIQPSFGVSALTGRGIGDMLDYIIEQLKKLGLDKNEKTEISGIAVSIVGKPNVGKSSIFNAILKEERVVVSPTAGTTRTAIDSQIQIDGQDYTFIDTAGLKKKEYRQAEPDVFSGFQTFKAVRRSDVCFFVIDANSEITKQDQKVASEILALQKGCVILANKCDLLSDLANKQEALRKNPKNNQGRAVQKPHDDSYHTVRDYISHHFPFLWMCPLFFISAVTGEGIDEAVQSIKPIFEARNKNLDGPAMKQFLAKKMKTNPPKLLRDQKNPKVYSLSQTEINPPCFELVVNHPAAISMQFRKYLENSIIRELDFWGTPIKLKLRGKDKS